MYFLTIADDQINQEKDEKTDDDVPAKKGKINVVGKTMFQKKKESGKPENG